MCLKESYRNGDSDSASCKLRGDPISNSLHMYVVCFSALKLWELSTNQYRYAGKPYYVTSTCPPIPDSSGSQRSWFIEPFFKAVTLAFGRDTKFCPNHIRDRGNAARTWQRNMPGVVESRRWSTKARKELKFCSARNSGANPRTSI